MRQHTINLYKFSELSSDAQRRAIEHVQRGKFTSERMATELYRFNNSAMVSISATVRRINHVHSSDSFRPHPLPQR